MANAKYDPDFFRACEEGDIKEVKRILNGHGKYYADINRHGADGNNPLIIASLNGHTEVVRALLAMEGVWVNMRNLKSITALFAACEKGHIGIVELLLGRPEIDVNSRALFNVSPLYVACENGHTEIVSMLIKAKKEEIELTGHLVESPLHVTCRKGFTQIVRLLLNNLKFDVNERSADIGDTPLRNAVRWGHYEIVRLLLDNGAKDSITFKGCGYYDPISLAVNKGHIETLSLLICHLDKYDDVRIIMSDDDTEECHMIIDECGKDFKTAKEKCQNEVKALLAAELFSIFTLITQGRLRLKAREGDPHNGKYQLSRFLSFANRLPLELVMIICNSAYNTKKQFISNKNIDFVMKNLFCL